MQIITWLFHYSVTFCITKLLLQSGVVVLGADIRSSKGLYSQSLLLYSILPTGQHLLQIIIFFFIGILLF